MDKVCDGLLEVMALTVKPQGRWVSEMLCIAASWGDTKKYLAIFPTTCRSSRINVIAYMDDEEEHVWVWQRQRSEVKVCRGSLGSSFPLESGQWPRIATANKMRLYPNIFSEIISNTTSCVNTQYIMFYKLTSARSAGKMRERIYISGRTEIFCSDKSASIILFVCFNVTCHLFLFKITLTSSV